MSTTSTSAHAPAHRRRSGRKAPPPLQPWCCSFVLDPLAAAAAATRSPLPAPRPAKPPHAPPLSRRIRSPGRVSPVDDPFSGTAASFASARLSSVSECQPLALPPPPPAAVVEKSRATLRLRLVEKGMILEVDEVERVRKESKAVRKVLWGGGGGEVAVEGKVEVEAVREAVEMMLGDENEAAAMRRLARGGVARAIVVLEVSFSLMFDRGVNNCLKYLEAVPWNEPEEESIKSLLSRHSSYEAASRNLLARLQPQNPTSSAELVVELIDSIAKGTNKNARMELRTLVNNILSKTSIYIKGDNELDMRSIYYICHSCLKCLVGVFEESSDLVPADQTAISVGKGPLERIYKQVEDLNWLLQIIIDRQMGEEFVDLWANEKTLSSMHERVSPMIRYELSRISATIFIAMGSGKLRCTGDKRFSIFQAWFRPMLVDFSWLRRYPKGLNITTLEEGIGQALLTLTLKQQQVLFMEWFEAFSGQGRECPNLMRAFQVWWRRSFVRSLGSS
ncbi:BTB/POZ domain-containing protein At2g13690-like [Phragmites australis]|uniref:BTB/POZ domain-containing protein At2g13690-like n=1 Tax=Phragmites australis TaxID=29695 RepID=UPI002D79E66A|nr:BTB/POZ domain-containing protein At2g13690-like [Phragmites australis]